MHHQEDYLHIDFRKNPHLYRIGIGEQGVLMAEPYKSEILPYWRFKTPAIAQESSQKIYTMFLQYLDQKDFVGADMARKFLQMGWTRSRRYANHASGRKYDEKGNIFPQEDDFATSQKAQSAKIFKQMYDLAKSNSTYQDMKKQHLKIYKKA